jgi:peptidoglycan/LPS O-acetylase OafA/YrhL
MTAAETPTADSARTSQSISEALNGHRNSLGLLRLVFAALVIVDHAVILGGFGDSPLLALTRGQVSVGAFAVAGFFTISGYLITKSGMTTDILQYLWRRGLRIFPAFWVVLVVGAFIVGPTIWLIEGRALGDYFTFGSDGPFSHLRADWKLTMHSFGIFDVFRDTTPYGRATGASVLNGSLWTLAYEWACYLLIGVFVLVGVLKRARALILATTAVFLLAEVIALVAPAALPVVVPVFADNNFVTLTLTFLFGACIAAYGDRIPFLDGLGLFAGIVVIATLYNGGFQLVGTAALAYFVLYVAARLPRRVQWIGAKNDYSYGLYIYGFLVTQILVYAGLHHAGYLPLVLASLALSGGLAWLSWHGVEKRAMALKDIGPGRGLRVWGGRIRALVLSRRRPQDAADTHPTGD